MIRTTLVLLALVSLFLAADASAAVSLGGMPEYELQEVEFDQIGELDPTFRFDNVPEMGTVSVSFGQRFAGQKLGRAQNSLTASAPVGPLRLTKAPGNVSTLVDLSNPSDLVLGGLRRDQVYTTPLAILFDKPVAHVSFNLGDLDLGTSTVIEAFATDGQSLGRFSDLASGSNQVALTESTGNRVIAGLSIFVPADGGMDWEGFGIGNVAFGAPRGGDPMEVVPEPATWVMWLVFGGMASVFYSWRRFRAR